MADSKPIRPAGRPVDLKKQNAILDAGWTLFLEHGVEGVSVEAIAAKAGVSKVTFYKHFADKTRLFEACVLQEMERIEESQRAGGDVPPMDLITTLRRFGIGVMSFIVSDAAVDFYNALAGELRRHEGLARSFYDLGPGRTRANLARILAAAAERGELEIANPEEAAEHLFGLWQGFSNFQLALNVESGQVRDTLPARIDRAIAVFLKAYRPSGD